MKSKERGSISVVSSPNRSVTNYEYRWVYAPTGWYKEYRETQSSYSHSFYRSDKENIQYELGKGNFNPCTHNRNKQPDLTLIPEFKFLATPGGATTWTKYGESRSSVRVPYDLASWSQNGNPEASLPTIPSYDWTSLVGDTGAQISGKLKASNNMLVELAQVGSTYGMLKHPFKSLDIRRFRKKLRSLGWLLKSSANAWLEYKYGWKNLYKAIQSLATCMNDARSHYLYLQMNAGRFTHIGSSDTTTSAWSGYFPYAVGSESPDHYCCGKRSKIEYRFSFGLDVIRPAAALHYSVMDLALQRLGQDDVVEALWDLVPFSFVADWFIGLDKWLQRDPIFFSSFNCRRVGYSVKAKYYAVPVIRQRIITASGSSPYPYTEWTSDEKLVYERYTRYPGFPSGTGAGSWSGLSTSQLLDGAALIVQRL